MTLFDGLTSEIKDLSIPVKANDYLYKYIHELFNQCRDDSLKGKQTHLPIYVNTQLLGYEQPIRGVETDGTNYVHS